ncbi:MAG: LamG domain-containing protein, partial [Bacteroidota bacterium]
ITNWYKNNVSTTVLYMPFEGVNGNEANNATDYSGYGNNGTVFGATWNRTGGKVGGGYLFNGINDYISVGEPQWDGIWMNHTITAWIKWTGKGLTANDTIISKGGGQPAGFHYVIWRAGGGLGNVKFYMNSLERTATTTLTPGDGLWKFMAVSLNNNNVTFYLNGVKDGSYSISDGGNNNFKLGIGYKDATTPADYFNGTIDEVKIYNYSLSAEQIQAEYQAGLAGKSSNILVRNETSYNDNWLCSVTPNDGYVDGQAKNSSAVTIGQANNAPTITAFTLIPAIANTSSNLECNATATDDLNTTFNVEYWWYNLTTFMLGGNKTVASNTNTVISILGAGNTTRFELWNCTVRAFDGTSYSGFNSSSINISNEVPTHDTPTITPVLPNTTSNLTCNWNNVLDSDSDAVVNITNWYKNNVSTTVLYMPFEGNGNEANNATDYSGYGNNGTVLGATWNRTGGKVGGAYVFDGINDNIIINYTPKFNTTNAITIMSWVKIAKVLPGGDWDFLIDKRNSYSYLQDESSSEIQAYIETTGGNKWCTFSDNNNLNLDTWYHLTMTYDSISGNMKAYKNGILNNTCSHSGTIIITTSPIKIGSEDGSYFNGSIDEVKIYNYSLSPEQIWADYQAGLAGRTSNVIVRNETSLNDNWICSVTPNDGYNDGQTKNSSAVTIAYTNIAPINWFSNITANQNLLYANSTLMGWCNATDLEGDTVSYKPVWYLNGQYNNSANNFTWNYQENSSETFCQTLYGNCYDFFDGNWSSYGGAEYYYMNYTIPPYASPDSRWMVKDSSQTYNITIAASCLGQNKLQLRTYMQEGFNNWTCWDGNNWKELNWSNHCCEVFEEAVWWKVISFDGVSYQQGISANVKNISSSLLSKGQNWTLECTANDGVYDSNSLNSSQISIVNTPPIHDTPTITPTLPNTTSNLTCNWNNVQDLDGDAVVNITNWYKNNVSTTVLYMPFEGVNGNEA